MNNNGTGSARQETPPRRLIAGPIPMVWAIGAAATGRAQASTDRRIVFAETALAA